MDILVIGSTNTDMVVKTKKLPAPGETILGGDFFMNPGGKGANQAVAAARLGGNVTFVTKVGNDLFGKQAIEHFKDENIDTQFCMIDSVNPSGVALITVDSKSENCIVVASGSNSNLLPADLEPAKEQIAKSDILLMQLETPLSTVIYAAEYAHKSGQKVILNPAPACDLPNELFKNLYLITPNETEASLLTNIEVKDIETATQAAHALQIMGVSNVIITMGSKGALLVTEDEIVFIPAEKVVAVDTTAAGDVFNGAIAVALAKNISLRDAVIFANKAAAISVTRMGAQLSAPYKNEIE
ncbi:MAG: ribokinase [Porphyromonadaceae bacterium CG2_30_38_12]|nr:MAG: ribokinase [Porphyromonadaceae bacterium CG2_30_38_12]